jgi:hypothetical protein
MTAIRVHTPVCYRGLPVTVIGRLDAALIAVAAYATPSELALGVITPEHDGARTLYRVRGDRVVATLAEAARIVVQLREANDHRD